MNIKVIISGHSAGLGLALSEYYLSQGCTVLGLARRRMDDRPSERLQQYRIDLSDSRALSAWLASGLLQDFIRDADELVLINNAATVAPNAIAGRQDALAISRAVALNVTAPMLLSNAVIAAVPEALPLKIVHMSSGAGRHAYPGWSIYGASKAALDQHALCVAAEKHKNINIISVAPGVIDTGMQAEIRAAAPDDFPILARFQMLKEQGGLSNAEDVAKMIAAMIAAENFGETVLRDARE